VTRIGAVGFRVWVGGGMGRTPVIGTVFNDFVPWQQILVYIEAIVRVYNLHGRRDNLYKARIKILVKAEGQRFVDDVNAEFAALVHDDSQAGAHLIPQAELDRVAACFGAPPVLQPGFSPSIDTDTPPAYRRWLERNVHGTRCRATAR
jgi:sulfite reductase (NADPH) hemoprotein beta-component